MNIAILFFLAFGGFIFFLAFSKPTVKNAYISIATLLVIFIILFFIFNHFTMEFLKNNRL